MTIPRERLAELYDKLDGFFARVLAAHAADMQCASGCSSCCTRFSITAPEAELVREAIAALDAEARADAKARALTEDAACPLLDERGRCRVYAARPAICRLHGLPVRLDDGATTDRRSLPVVSSCEKNFTRGADVGATDVLDQRTVSAIVAAIARAHEEESRAPSHRVAITDLCL